MKRERLTNRELDELGKRLVAAAKPGEGEIERLVSNPRLYDGVLAKIAELDSVEKPGRRIVWKPVAAMAGAAVLVSVSMLAYLKLGVSKNEFVSKPQAAPFVVADEKPFVADLIMPEPRRPEADDDRPRAIPAVATRTVEAPPPRRTRKQRIERVPAPEPVFHPIGLDERAEDAAIDGRVVRVDMPRSALFALGVDLPLENGTRSVKADLLVGADGIPKGIRLVE